MAIFLVQHGISLKKEDDPEKGLSQKGREETAKIAEVAKLYKVPVAEICHSGKKRALETAQIFKDILGVNTSLQEKSNINPLDDVEIFGKMVDPASNMMMVGHLPYMEKLVSFLAAGDADRRILKFQNSGIVCLDSEKGNWFIKWTLNPNIS